MDRSQLHFYSRFSSHASMALETASPHLQSPSPSASKSSSVRAGLFRREAVDTALWRSRSGCKERGCVFPAAAGLSGLCSYHELWKREPQHFEMLQPSLLVLSQAVFGLPEREQEDFRAVDRRKLGEERATFLLEEAA